MNYKSYEFFLLDQFALIQEKAFSKPKPYEIIYFYYY
jgi:hypothetical protein